MGDMASRTEVLIIGSGPAGLQAGYFFNQRGIDFRILERAPHVSAFLRKFPRHRTFISVNKVNTGLSNPDMRMRYDWNSLINDEEILFGHHSKAYFPKADDFTAYAERFARPFADKIRCESDVVEISKEEDTFSVICADGSVHHAAKVIVATGVSQAWESGIEGIELAENYTEFDPTPELYDNKRVLILGKGNSAFETADSLIPHAAAIHVMSPNPLRLAWQTHFVGHLRAVNNNFLDTYQLKSQNAVIDAEVFRIEREGDALKVSAHMRAAEGHDIVLTYDHVIACTGFQFDNSIFAPDLQPEMRHYAKFPVMGADWQSDKVSGLYFAGTIMQSCDYRKTMSGFIHGFRHNVQTLCDFVEADLRGTPLPTDVVDLDPEALNRHIINRLSTSSAIFLQPGFLSDVFVLEGSERGKCYRDVPVQWAAEQARFADVDRLQITLEYGDFGKDTLHVKRQHNMFGKEPDAFLHPVVRHMRGAEVLAEMHLADHLDADWRPRAERDQTAATVLEMTFQDAGGTKPPSEVATEQLRHFLTGIAGLDRVATAAE